MQQSVLLTDDVVISSVFAALGGHPDVFGMCSHLRPMTHTAAEDHEWAGDPYIAKGRVPYMSS